MSIKTNVYKLNEILSRTDDELVGNWSRLASLIKNFEKMEWRDSQQLASQMIKDGKAKAYVEKVRNKVSSTQKKPVSKKNQSTSKKKKKKTKVIPINTKRDRFCMNYKRLLEIAPDLIEQLESGEHIHGKSQRSGYQDFNLELIDSDKAGYYLAMSHYFKQNGDLVPDPDMQILVSIDRETVEALTIQNQWYFKEVYDNMFNRKMVRLNEKKSQNAFLEQWLKNLISQGHLIEWEEDQERNKEEKETLDITENLDKKTDLSFLPKELIESFRNAIEEVSIKEVNKTYSS